MKQRNKM